uniref:Guided entry of tail-anchored proteins factor 1 n=1 Tax=Caenorhabditis japonica TaxID=281687 RepID=A0A8R1HQ24_CAEJA
MSSKNEISIFNVFAVISSAIFAIYSAKIISAVASMVKSIAKSKPNPKLVDLKSKIAQTKRKLNGISPTGEFAKYFKKDRELNKLNDELAVLEAENPSENAKNLKIDTVEGLYTPDGYLFYHTSPAVLTKKQIQRVEEHGINLRARNQFTIEESVQIFKNWKEYAENHKMKLKNARDYIKATKKEKHVVKHQEENQFWPKLCAGLPHRHCNTIKVRAVSMMTDNFLETLDWNDLEKQIAEAYYTHVHYDDVTLAKARHLLDKGYSGPHVGEILDISKMKTIKILDNLRKLETRDDPKMVQNFFESAQAFGLDVEKLQRLLIAQDEERFFRKLRKDVKFEEMSLKMHMSEQSCKLFLKEQILKKIWDEFHKNVQDEGKSEQEAVEEAMKIVLPKPELTSLEKIKALEIFCKKCKKDDTSAELAKNGKLAKKLKSKGITGFQCDQSEYGAIYKLITHDLMIPLDRNVFDNLRRSFRFQLKLHVLLWGWKRMEVWETLPVKKSETRYEVVLRAELENPLASETTKKFLKNRDVAEWIMEPFSGKTSGISGSRRRELATEAFILYSHRKYGGKFKFPAKLCRQVLPNISKSVERILDESEGDENQEYLSRKDAKKAVESAADSKISVRVKSKKIMARHEDSEDSEDDSEDVEQLLEYARGIEKEWAEQRRREIQEVLEKADPKKRKKKFRMQDEEGSDRELELHDDIHRQKRALNKIIRAQKANERFKSKEFVEDSSDSDGEKVQNDEEEKAKRDQEDSEEPEPESVEKEKKKKKKRRRENSEEIEEDNVDIEKKKKKKRRKMEENSDL